MFVLRWRNQKPPPVVTGHFHWRSVANVQRIVDTLLVWGGAHRVFRNGWQDRAPRAVKEWDLDHSSFLDLAATNLAFLLVPGQLRPPRCGVLGKVHDWGEKVDHTPHEGLVPRDTKKRRHYFRTLPVLNEWDRSERQRLKNLEEEATMAERTAVLEPRLGAYYLRAWREYRDQNTAAAVFVHQVHALLDCVRAVLYKQDNPKEPFNTFFDTAREVIEDPFLLEVVGEIERRYRDVEESVEEQSPSS